MSIITVKNVGKKYKINHQLGGYIALRDVLTNVIKHPFGFAKQKVQAVSKSLKKEEFWALEDINFEVKAGEVVGIIGKNGAGKSTLLKILSQITPPTTGEVRINGRIGSLLEVGTGFHPELTGRENILLNGAIMGMRKKEIIEKFDQIVEFAGVEKFLDTPVKYYSSGMYVRLAFSVAAHLEPDILIVDEVLAVGDSEFQKKCLGKMQEVTKTHGRTVLFVSHNMSAIRNLCNRCILLEGGKVKMIGDTQKVVNEYLSIGQESSSVEIKDRDRLRGNKSAYIESIALKHEDKDDVSNVFAINEPIELAVDYEVREKLDLLSFWVIFYDNEGRAILSSFQKDVEVMKAPEKGKHKIFASFKHMGLLPGIYSVSMGIFAHRGSVDQIDFADWVQHVLSITIVDNFYHGPAFDQRLGIITQLADWKS